MNTINHNQVQEQQQQHKTTKTTTAAAAATTDSTDNNNEDTTSTTSMQVIHRFGKFIIPRTNVFCISKLGSVAFVNLRPIVPGHVLVMPKRIVPYLHDLTEEEYIDMWLLVRRVQSVLKDAYKDTSAYNIAVQDGNDAGQSVPHVHVHILPRCGGDFTRNDDVYDRLEEWGPTIQIGREKTKSNIDVPADNQRIDRTEEMMAEEAKTYRRLFNN